MVKPPCGSLVAGLSGVRQRRRWQLSHLRSRSERKTTDKTPEPCSERPNHHFWARPGRYLPGQALSTDRRGAPWRVHGLTGLRSVGESAGRHTINPAMAWPVLRFACVLLPLKLSRPGQEESCAPLIWTSRPRRAPALAEHRNELSDRLNSTAHYLDFSGRFLLAGAPGFEPGNGGTKNRCLTTWRRPNREGVFSQARGGLQEAKSDFLCVDRAPGF